MNGEVCRVGTIGEQTDGVTSRGARLVSGQRHAGPSDPTLIPDYLHDVLLEAAVFSMELERMAISTEELFALTELTA